MAELASYKKVDYRKIYDEAIENNRRQAQAAYEKVVMQAGDEQARIKSRHDGLRANAAAQARLTAMGSREEMAAKGLGGSAYGPVRSGADATLRTMENTALQNRLGSIGLQEESLLQEQRDRVSEAALDRDADVAAYERDVRLKQMEDERKQQNEWLDYQLRAYSAQQAAQKYQQDVEQAALEQAYRELELFGKVMTRKAAAALGVSVGTTTLEYNKLKKTGKI
ncbi:MAG: hypothetical protein IJP03_04730 [Christensenellaceae bacterium]|nr:hypothetical protein [Christensenellaceae bacterium]